MSSRTHVAYARVGAQPSASRRERKKSKQNDDLISAANALFVERGFDEASMEEIAENADVATSTLYKYFPTKRSLLLAVARKVAADTAARLDACVDALPDDVVDAVVEQARLVWGPPMTPGEKGLWRHMRAAAFLTETPEAGSFESNRQSYADLIYRLLARLRDRGRMAQSADLRTLAAAIYAIRLHGFSRYVTVADLTMDAALAEVRAQTAAIMIGWLPANDDPAAP